jgi:hypothetical protein
MPPQPNTTETLNRTELLATIRRLYFYLIATVSLLVGLSGFISLLEILSEVWLGDVGMSVNTTSYVRNVVALNGGMLLVALPIFLVHWLYIRRLKTDPNEKTSGIRKFSLYLISIITLGWGAALAGELLQGVVELLLGVPLVEVDIWPSDWLFLALGILANGTLFVYLQHQLQTDSDWGHEMGWAGIWRRVFQTVVGLVGLSVLISGAGVLLETLWQMIFPSAERDVGEYWMRGRLSMGFAMLVIGGFLWRFNWLRWQQVIRGNPSDGRTALRRLYLYGSVIISAVATLVPAAVLLRLFLLLLFGVNNTSETAGGSLSTPLAFLPVGFVFWLWHWRLIQREAASYGDSPESALVRRIYYYSVAAIGLILTWFGLVDILRVLLDFFLPAQTALSGQFRAEQLANGLSLLAIGAPVWALHWRAVQFVARQPDKLGQAERSSWPRRVYLYGVALAGALILLYNLTTVVYRLLLLLLGEPGIELFGIEAIDALARSTITLVFWSVHVLAIRRDAQSEIEEKPSLDEEVQVTGILNRKRELQVRIRRLEDELSAARSELAELDNSEEAVP